MLARFEGRSLDPSERKVVDDVEKVGWHVVMIREEDGRPGWAFTIGLFETFSHPEVVIFGLSQDHHFRILNWIGENICRGTPFTVDQEHDWVLKGLGSWSREVQRCWYRDLLGFAIWFYGGTNFPCVQCVWPAKDGTFPWQEKSPFSGSQPLLYERDVTAARMFHYIEDADGARAAWPFPCDPHLRVFVSRCVVEDGAPIVSVFHDHDGDWQFIGPVDDPVADGVKVSCFHCVLERDPTIRSLARLDVGWRAWRDGPSGEWNTAEFDEEPE